MLLVVALLGLILPNAFLVHWLVYEHPSLGGVTGDRLALAFILDLAMSIILLCVHFARSPIGRHRWPWFLALSLLGGLAFSLPFYWWLNRNRAPVSMRAR